MSGAREGRTELKATGGRVGHRLSIAARYFLRNEAKKSFSINLFPISRSPFTCERRRSAEPSAARPYGSPFASLRVWRNIGVRTFARVIGLSLGGFIPLLAVHR